MQDDGIMNSTQPPLSTEQNHTEEIVTEDTMLPFGPVAVEINPSDIQTVKLNSTVEREVEVKLIEPEIVELDPAMPGAQFISDQELIVEIYPIAILMKSTL